VKIAQEIRPGGVYIPDFGQIWSLTQGHTLFYHITLILITANMQSETGFPSSYQLKSYVASKSCLKLAAIFKLGGGIDHVTRHV